jgi:hypothetical protein
MNRVRQAIRNSTANLFGTMFAALREVFDEAPYARFLNRTGMESSIEAYAAFRREFEEAKVRRPRCC